ncbi:MAG TPA: hypothetical protein VFW40_02150 [Capsulimonadaceae bacterium]|nr:hypothetical protein [Capsulimonadaceae bacterium]
MPSKFSMSVIFNKIAQCKRLSHTESQFVEERYESLKRSYQSALSQCDEAERGAIALSEAQCEVEARLMERDYRLALRLDEKLAGQQSKSRWKKSDAASTEDAGIAYRVCLACYYDTQLENMLATQDVPLSSEFLSALSDLEAALVHLNQVTKTERSRGLRAWAN